MKSVAEAVAGKSLRWVFGVAALAVVALLAAASLKSWRDLRTVEARRTQLEQRLGDTKARMVELEYRRQLLERDPATLERLAREEMGMAGKDDLVFVLPAPAAAPPGTLSGSPPG